MRLNAKDRLNVTKADRREQAWQRVVLGWGSKQEIHDLCGVPKSTIGNMRKVKKAFEAQDEKGKALRSKGGELKDLSWAWARLSYLGWKPEEITVEEEARLLAKILANRLTNLLKRDPAITARALEMYDPELPRKLVRHWNAAEPYAPEDSINPAFRDRYDASSL